MLRARYMRFPKTYDFRKLHRRANNRCTSDDDADARKAYAMYTEHDSCRSFGTKGRSYMPEYIYCVSCMANSEMAVARSIEEILRIRAVYLSYDREERKNGVWRVVTHPMHWGYVFLYADTPVDPMRIYAVEHVCCVLRYSDGECSLRGGDRDFAEWALACNGHIGLSRALLVGDKTRIIDGPLKDYEGVIQSIDRHRRRALVNVTVGDDVKPIHMYFEWLTLESGRLVKFHSGRQHSQ